MSLLSDYLLEIKLWKPKQRYQFKHEATNWSCYETDFIKAGVLSKETPELPLKVVVLGLITFNDL